MYERKTMTMKNNEYVKKSFEQGKELEELAKKLQEKFGLSNTPDVFLSPPKPWIWRSAICIEDARKLLQDTK